MEKYKELYEQFKNSANLTDRDYQFIEISEKLINNNRANIVYTELWLHSWINTATYLKFIKKLVDGIVADGKNECFIIRETYDTGTDIRNNTK